MPSNERNSFDIQAEEIARNTYRLCGRYAGMRSWGRWEDVSCENKAIMIAVVKKLLIDNIIEPGSELVTN